MYDTIKIFHMQNKPMQFKNIPKFPDHCLIFTEVQPKRILNRQTYEFTKCGFRKYLEQDHHKAEIFATKKNLNTRSFFRKNIAEQTLKIYAYRRTV